MLIFMFLSSFLHKIGCYRRKTPILGAKLVKISHIRKRETHFFNKKSYFISFSSPYPFSSPFVCHLSPSEPHRNLIGTSSESHWMMSVSSSSYYRDLNNSHLIWFSLTLYTKKSRSPCAYAIFSLPLQSNLLHRSYYENNHHYPSSNYGTQILSSLWCCIPLSARESR